ncbi:MAG TPA: glutamate synthase [Thiotrichales bacterium]|nr:glutamate synthase [Thiotrichales bacterium]
MNISGVLVRSRPEKVFEVRRALEAIEGVEVHAATEDGRLIVTVEEDGDRAMADKVLSLQDLPGVIAASMVYHQFEDDEYIEQEA